MKNFSHRHRRSRKGKMPPLSCLDWALYFLCLILAVALLCAVLLGKDMLVRFLWFHNPVVIASTSPLEELGPIPIMAVLTLGLFIPPLAGMMNRIPIFGNPKISYGESPWDDTYPIFWRKKPKKRSFYLLPPVLRNYRVVMVLVCFFIFVIFSCFSGLFTRDSLENSPDACLVHYNFMNRPSAAYAMDDVVSLTISSDWINSRYSGQQWGYTATLRTVDGRRFHFISLTDRSPYLANSQDAMLELLLEIKTALPPEAVTIEGAGDVNSILDTMGREQSLLLELFDVPHTFG